MPPPGKEGARRLSKKKGNGPVGPGGIKKGSQGKKTQKKNFRTILGRKGGPGDEPLKWTGGTVIFNEEFVEDSALTRRQN